MFCPNCGTKNEESAQRCRQCGLELAEKKAAPKFKGTMMMGNSPFAGMQPGGAVPPGAVPSTTGATAAGAPAAGAPAAPQEPPAAPAQPRSAFKGTMVGVAPQGGFSPGGFGAPGPAAPQTPAAGQPPAQAPAAARPAHLKGTMIGVAPQGGFGAQTPPTPAASPAAQPPAAQPPAAQPPAAGAASQANKLKGTMIGVAPQGFNPQGFNPQGFNAQGGQPQEPVAQPAPAAQPPTDATRGAGFDATQAFGHNPTEPPPPSPTVGAYAKTTAFSAVPDAEPLPRDVNPLGGTMLGAAIPDAFQHGAGAQQGAVASTQPNPVYVPPGQPSGSPAPAFGDLSGEARLSAPAAFGQPAPYGAITGTSSHGPIGKDRNPLLVLVLTYATCGIYGLISLIGMLSELRAFRQKNDISLLLFFLPIIQIIEILKLPEKVAEAQRLAGIQNPQVAHPVLYLFFGMYFLPADLNETWAAARRNAG